MKFAEIGLHPLLATNLEKIQFVECTGIQEQAIPLVRQGKDVAGLAQTGTGKTGAFLIPLIDRILKAMHADQAPADSTTVAFTEWRKKNYILVVVPTRELAEQVQENADKLLRDTGLSSVSVYGGTSYDKQTAAMRGGVELVIATPGRLIDLYKEHIVDLGLVRAMVFDEADRMFDMGFKDDMKFILRRVPRDRQFLVFSATLNFDVLNVAYEFGADPVEINISRDQAKAENVKDYIFHVGQDEKPQYLLSILKKHNPRQAIIFSNFKFNVERIARFLSTNGIPAVGISSLLTQGQRNRVMAQFKGANNDRNILVATDLAARGLDILGVDMVLNYELPDDAENYVHRIGRTGRAGQTGQAFSLVSDRDVDAIQRIEEYLKHKVEALWLEDEELIKDFSAFPRDEGGKKPAFKARERFNGGGGGQQRRPQQGGSPQHRDRQSGRHGDRHPRREGQGPRHEQRDQRQGQGQQQGRHRNSNQQGRRDHRQNDRRGHDQRPRHHGQQRPHHGRHRGGSHRVHRPGGAPPMAASAGLGARVTGFFKRLFGGKES